MIYMFLSNNPSSGDINSSNLPCFNLANSADLDKIQHLGVSNIQRANPLLYGVPLYLNFGQVHFSF